MEIKVVAAVFVRDNELLTVRKEKKGISTIILPGGKTQGGESDLDCLAREIYEELPHLRYVGSFSPYEVIHGISPNNKSQIETRIYRFYGDANYDLRISDNPEEPIKQADFFDYAHLIKLPLSEVTLKLVEFLRGRRVL